MLVYELACIWITDMIAARNCTKSLVARGREQRRKPQDVYLAACRTKRAFLYTLVNIPVAFDTRSWIHLRSPPSDGRRLIEPVKKDYRIAGARPVKWRGGHPPLIRLLLLLEAPTRGNRNSSWLTRCYVNCVVGFMLYERLISLGLPSIREFVTTYSLWYHWEIFWIKNS